MGAFGFVDSMYSSLAGILQVTLSLTALKRDREWDAMSLLREGCGCVALPKMRGRHGLRIHDRRRLLVFFV